MITLVPVNRIDAVWPHVCEQLHKAVMRTGGDVSVAWLWEGCRRGEIYMFVVTEGDKITGVSVWKPETWQTGQKLRCLALAGNLDTVQDMRNAGRQLAVECGASSIIGEGSEAYARIFPNAKPLRTLYEELI